MLKNVGNKSLLKGRVKLLTSQQNLLTEDTPEQESKTQKKSNKIVPGLAYVSSAKKTMAVKFIKVLGKGTSNTVHLAWDIKSKKFIAIRKGNAEVKTKVGDTAQKTEKVASIFRQLIECSGQDRDLLEQADILAEDEKSSSPVTIRELAVEGDLTKASGLFARKPKQLLGYLLKQIKISKKAKIGIGDLKPDNVNVYRNSKGEAIPKFSDLEGSVSAQDSSKSISKALTSIKRKVSSGEDLTKIIKGAINVKYRNEGDVDKLLEDHGVTLESFKELKQAFHEVLRVQVSPGYTFGNEDNHSAFNQELESHLIKNIENFTQPNHEGAVTNFVEWAVDRIQQIDAKAMSVTFIEGFLGDKTEVIREDLYSLLQGNTQRTEMIDTTVLQTNESKSPQQDRNLEFSVSSEESNEEDDVYDFLDSPLQSSNDKDLQQGRNLQFSVSSEESNEEEDVHDFLDSSLLGEFDNKQETLTEKSSGNSSINTTSLRGNLQEVQLDCYQRVRDALTEHQQDLPKEDQLSKDDIDFLMTMLLQPSNVNLKKIDKEIQRLSSTTGVSSIINSVNSIGKNLFSSLRKNA
jgi:hypothetical protein